jgi:hypothetical protein
VSALGLSMSTHVLTLYALCAKEILYRFVGDEVFPFTEDKVHSDSNVCGYSSVRTGVGIDKFETYRVA